MAEAAAAAVAGGTEQKLKIDKFADGAVTCLKFVGTIDEQFDGKKTAATLKGGTVVLDLAEISKISSFGIREWVDFIGQLGQRVDSIYLIECAPKVVDQLNMVANFAGKGRVFSFYAPYRCDYCDADRRVLLQADRDFEAIKGMKPPERPCQGCGNPEYFDEDPTSFFSFLAAQPKFELDPVVAGFLASKLNYAVSDSARRLRVEKHIEGRSVYLKIAGDLDGSFPREKLAEGMEGTLVLDVSGIGKVDPAGAAEWRGFLTMITPTTEKIYLLGCPPVFLERLTKQEDLGAKAQVMSFAMPYSCAKCATTASQLVDVEAHFDVLKFATPPEMKCLDCKGPTSCAASEALLSHLPTLPKPSVEPALKKFIKEVQERKPEKPQVATTVAEAAAAGRRSNFVTLVVAVAAAAAVAVGVVVFMNYQKQKEAEKRRAARDAVGAIKDRSADERATWIATDTRFSAGCVADEAGGVTCVGVSSYADTQDDAQAEAVDAALEELANVVADKLPADKVTELRRVYGDARNLAINNFEQVKNESDGAAYDRARKAVRDGRKNVAAVLLKSSLMKPQADDQYWEEYEPVYGTGSRWLVFAKFTVSPDKLKQLTARYETTVSEQGVTVMTLFPSIAWRYPDVTAGAVIVHASNDGAIGKAGLQSGMIVIEVNRKNVADAPEFGALVKAETEILKKTCGSVPNTYLPITIKGENQPLPYNAMIDCPVIAKEPVNSGGNSGKTGRGGTGGTGGTGGVNVWDKTGGGTGKDNPDD